MIDTPAKLKKARVNLEGMDGNAFILIGHVQLALKRAGNSRDVCEQFREEAMSGDYDHVLQTIMAYTEPED